MASQDQYSPGPLTIPLFVGTIINWTLLGSLVVQVYLYFVAFPKDPRFTKVLVAVVFLAELLQTFADGHDSLKSLVGAGWGNPVALDEVNWAWFSVPVLGSTIASVGQIFFAWRLYIIAQNMIVPGIIAFFTAIQLGAGIWTGVIIAQVHKFSLLEYRLVKPPTAWLAATAVTDLIIVGGTIYYLLKARQPGFHKSTDDVLSHIIKVTFATGTMCALFAILDLALYIKYDGNNYHLSVCLWLSKVYSNSMLVILNSRARIGHGHTGVHVSSGHISNTVTSDIAFREYGNHREMKTMRGTASQTLHSIQESNQDHQGDGEKEFYNYAV